MVPIPNAHRCHQTSYSFFPQDIVVETIGFKAVMAEPETSPRRAEEEDNILAQLLPAPTPSMHDFVEEGEEEEVDYSETDEELGNEEAARRTADAAAEVPRWAAIASSQEPFSWPHSHSPAVEASANAGKASHHAVTASFGHCWEIQHHTSGAMVQRVWGLLRVSQR